MLVFITPKLTDQRLPYSYRSRAEIPSQHIEDSRVTDDIESLKSGDVAVLGKKHTQADAEYCIANKIKYIVDVADDKFQAAAFKHWYWTIPRAERVTTTCNTLRDLIKQLTGADSTVIPDPTERPRGKPCFRPGTTVNAVYYGAEKNYSKLNWLDIRQTLNSTRKTHITIMTNVPERPINFSKLRKKIHGYGQMTPEQQLDVEAEYCLLLDQLVEWDFDLQHKLVEQSDFVLLPVVSDRLSLIHI